jgi:hypothetical protein
VRQNDDQSLFPYFSLFFHRVGQKWQERPAVMAIKKEQQPNSDSGDQASSQLDEAPCLTCIRQFYLSLAPQPFIKYKASNSDFSKSTFQNRFLHIFFLV